jgi:hypothetical protein
MSELKDRLAVYLYEKKMEYQDQLRQEAGDPTLEVEDYQHAHYMGIPPTTYSDIKMRRRAPSEERMEKIARTYPDVYDALGVGWMRESNKIKQRLAKKLATKGLDMTVVQLEFVHKVSDQVLDGSIDIEDNNKLLVQ